MEKRKSPSARRALIALLLASLPPLLLLAAGCATPVAPTGGPIDRTPPRLVASFPAADSTGVRTDRVVLTFSEPVDAASVRRALAVVPEPASPPRIRTSGREVEVVFADSLRPDVTVVLTLGTDLEDLRDVSITQPITLAFSTGDRLDRGRLGGRVVQPATGEPAAGLAVLAYRLDADTTALPDPRRDAPDYRTEVGADGRFQLDYLSADPFFVVALDDRNRNRRADPGERFAVPPRPRQRATSPADTTEADTLAATPALPARYLVTALDSIPPRVRRVRALAADRFEVRLDEAIGALQPEAWAVDDSLTGEAAALRGVFVSDLTPTAAVVLTADPLTGRQRLRLGLGAVRDSSGNALRDTLLGVSAGADPDTTQLRFAGFVPSTPDSLALRLDRPPGVAFTLPLSREAVRERTALTDAAGAAVPFDVVSETPRRWLIQPASGTRAGLDLRLSVAMRDSTYTRRVITPAARVLGEIVGTISGFPAGAPVIVEAYPPQGPPYLADADENGAFVLRGLPAGDYRLRAWADLDGDGRWTGGRLAPYAPPEPLYLSDEPVTVRSRFETLVDLTVPDG